MADTKVVNTMDPNLVEAITTNVVVVTSSKARDRDKLPIKDLSLVEVVEEVAEVLLEDREHHRNQLLLTKEVTDTTITKTTRTDHRSTSPNVEVPQTEGAAEEDPTTRIRCSDQRPLPARNPCM